MEHDPHPPQQRTEQEQVTVRRVSVLNCCNGKFTSGKKEGVIIVTLGHEDASVDQLGLILPETKKLLYDLAVALGRENLPLGPATEQKILRRWCIPHSVGRAELNVEGNESEYLDQLKHDMPELGEYVMAQLNSLRRVLHRVGKGAAKPETLLDRVTRFVLIALDTARANT